jgi:hypothetical protein
MKMIYAPNKDTSRNYVLPNVSVFLAGGITGCSDWQAEFYELLKDKLGSGFPATIYNPRRPQFPMDDPKAAKQQIEWEFEQLQECDILAFWFAPETLNPIVLYELGFQMGKVWANGESTRIVVGVHPDYQRKQDVEIQMKLAMERETIISGTLEVLAARVAGFMREEAQYQSPFQF